MNTAAVTAYDIERIRATIRAAASVWGVSSRDIIGRSRAQPVALARQAAMTLVKHMTGISLAQIGECFGNRDHGSVKHAINTIEKRMHKPRFRSQFGEVVHLVNTATHQH